jgi:hypothetical protein
MTHAEALLVARGGELVQLASESSKQFDSTTGAIHVARAFNTHLPERGRAARRVAENAADAARARYRLERLTQVVSLSLFANP